MTSGFEKSLSQTGHKKCQLFKIDKFSYIKIKMLESRRWARTQLNRGL